MTETSTTPSRAKACPSYTDTADEPCSSEPPWIHTITGRPAPVAVGAASGVQTLRLRQSSPGTSGSGSSSSSGGAYGRLGAVGPNPAASRTPSQGSGATGGRKRLGPTGAAAYGMPR